VLVLFSYKAWIKHLEKTGSAP